MRDEELQRTPYAELWLSEMGATVPEYRPGMAAQPRPIRPGRRARAPLPVPPGPCACGGTVDAHYAGCAGYRSAGGR